MMVYIISVNSAAFYFTHKSLNSTTNIRNHMSKQVEYVALGYAQAAQSAFDEDA
jgi:hypothetical protein